MVFSDCHIPWPSGHLTIILITICNVPQYDVASPSSPLETIMQNILNQIMHVSRGTNLQHPCLRLSSKQLRRWVMWCHQAFSAPLLLLAIKFLYYGTALLLLFLMFRWLGVVTGTHKQGRVFAEKPNVIRLAFHHEWDRVPVLGCMLLSTQHAVL